MTLDPRPSSLMAKTFSLSQFYIQTGSEVTSVTVGPKPTYDYLQICRGKNELPPFDSLINNEIFLKDPAASTPLKFSLPNLGNVSIPHQSPLKEPYAH